MRLVNKEYTVRLILNNLGDYQVETKDPRSSVWHLAASPVSSVTEALEIFYKESHKDKSKLPGGTILCQA